METTLSDEVYSNIVLIFGLFCVATITALFTFLVISDEIDDDKKELEKL